MNNLLLLHHRLLSQNAISVLPDGYIECEYIENKGNTSTSTAYINTGIIPTINTRVLCDIELIKNIDNWQSPFGSRARYLQNGWCLYINTLNQWGSFYGAKSIYQTVSPIINNTGKHIVDFNKNILKVDNSSTTFAPSSIKSSYPIWIFTSNDQGKQYWSASMKLFSFKIWDNDILKRDYIPCYEISSSLYGLYDKVTKQFFKSPNGIKFGGKIKSSDNYIEREYIENTSTAYIDTGFKPNQNTRVQTKMNILSFAAWQGFFGCRGNGAVPAYALYFYSKNVFYGHFGPSLYNNFVSTYPATGIHNIEFNHGALKIDSNIHNIGSFTYQLPVNMYIFGTNENNTNDSHANIRLYSFKIWDNNVLKRDYIPCKEKSSGLYGLYDRVENKFYSSPNGVKFIGG